MSSDSRTVTTPLFHGLGRKKHGEACRAGTCHRANGTEVMGRSVLPDAAVTVQSRGLSRASQHCSSLKSLPVALIYEQTASKSGLTLPVHLSLSLVKSADSFANLSSLLLSLQPPIFLKRP